MDAHIEWTNIVAKAGKLKSKSKSDLGRKVRKIIDSANGNAYDTIYVEKAQPHEQYEYIALGSLSDLLSDRDADKKVQAWFRSIGFKY